MFEEIQESTIIFEVGTLKIFFKRDINLFLNCLTELLSCTEVSKIPYTHGIYSLPGYSLKIVTINVHFLKKVK